MNDRKRVLAILGAACVLAISGCSNSNAPNINDYKWDWKWPIQKRQNTPYYPQQSQPQTTVPAQPQTPAKPYPPGLHGDYANYPQMRQFIGDMSRKHKFDIAFLEQTFSGVRRSDEVLAKVKAPAEGKPWSAYRPIFITEERIRGGVGFWNKHSAALQAAASRYGVAPEYLVAIIGVETYYGRNVGKYNVLQSLTTLAFDYPPRADFYRKELENFLLLSREEKLNPHQPLGSYAGAMGLGQFISSSYRNYAVDFNHDQHRDLWNADDAIGSVANYFSKHGWKRGGDVAIPARLTGSAYSSYVDTTAKKPRYTLSQLANVGVRPIGAFWSDKVSLIQLEGSKANEYWIGGDNFYTITRYNHSPKYAMAVHQLAQEIKRRKAY